MCSGLEVLLHIWKFSITIHTMLSVYWEDLGELPGSHQKSDSKSGQNRLISLIFLLLFSACFSSASRNQANTWHRSDSVCLWRATAGRWDAGLTRELDQSNLVRPRMNRWNSRSGPVHTALGSNGRLTPGLGDAAAHGSIYKRKKNVEHWKKYYIIYLACLLFTFSWRADSFWNKK